MGTSTITSRIIQQIKNSLYQHHKKITKKGNTMTRGHTKELTEVIVTLCTYSFVWVKWSMASSQQCLTVWCVSSTSNDNLSLGSNIKRIKCTTEKRHSHGHFLDPLFVNSLYTKNNRFIGRNHSSQSTVSVLVTSRVLVTPERAHAFIQRSTSQPPREQKIKNK